MQMSWERGKKNWSTLVYTHARTDVSFLGSQSKAVDFITSTHVRRRRNRDREVRVFRTGSVAIVIRGRHRGLDCPCFLYVRLKHERSDCLSDVTFSGIAPLSWFAEIDKKDNSAARKRPCDDSYDAIRRGRGEQDAHIWFESETSIEVTLAEHTDLWYSRSLSRFIRGVDFSLL